MEFNIVEFVDILREYLYGFFPFESEEMVEKKHAKRPLHIRDIAFMWLPTSTSETGNTITFNIGSEYAEENYPYYHILQDAPVIHKRNRGTEKSKGTQGKITNLSQRDYSRIKFNGKIYSKEYQKNVRGERAKVVQRSTRTVYTLNGTKKINVDARTYENVHYKYIDKILDTCVPYIADYFELKLKRKVDTGMEEEYSEQYKQDNQNLNVGNWNLDILNIMESFEE